MPRRIPVRRSADAQTKSVADSNYERISCEPHARASAAVARFLHGTANTALIARLWPARSGSGQDAANGAGRGTTSIPWLKRGDGDENEARRCATNTCVDIERRIAWEPGESSSVDGLWMKQPMG
jgi:hypothetical protein